MAEKRRGRRGAVHLFKPSHSATWWIRYTHRGQFIRKNTGHADQGEARIFAATVERMLGLVSSNQLQEKRRLLEIAKGLLHDLPELELEAASVGNLANLPTTRQWFLNEIKNAQAGKVDDRTVTQQSIERLGRVDTAFIAYLEKQPTNLADAPLNRVSPADIIGFLAELKANGYSGKTRKFSLTRIRGIFGHAVFKGLLPLNPASVKQTGRMRFDTTSIRQSFNPRQVAAILQAIERFPYRWMKLSAFLGLYTGQRVGDICAMCWEQVRDFDGPMPTLALTQQKTHCVVVIPLAEPLWRLLAQTPLQDRKGYLLPDEVACAVTNRYKNKFNLPWRELLNSVDLAGLSSIPIQPRLAATGKGRTRYAWSYHSWRHTTATYLSGPDAHYLLGHRQQNERGLGMTAQYRHEDLYRLKRALEAIPLDEPSHPLPPPIAVDIRQPTGVQA